MPLISVVIPVFNGEKTIQKTIESVLNQTFQSFELIIINDGSTDSTFEIVSKIDNPRLKVFSYLNAGLPASRNRGIKQASGEYISFIDADDLWTKDKLELQLKALQGNPEAAVAYSWTHYIDDSGKFLHPGSYISVSGDVYANLLLVNFLENGSNPLIRAQALTEVGGFDESLTSAEDWDMWIRLAARYHFAAVPLPQILYRVSTTSMSTNVLKMELATLQVMERAFSQAPPSLKYLKPYSQANLFKYLAYKALDGLPMQQRGIAAARFFWSAICKDTELLPPRRELLKIWLKIALVVLLPPQLAQSSIAKFGTLPKIHNRLVEYLRLEP